MNTVTKEQVQDNMRDVIIKTSYEFDIYFFF